MDCFLFLIPIQCYSDVLLDGLIAFNLMVLFEHLLLEEIVTTLLSSTASTLVYAISLCPKPGYSQLKNSWKWTSFTYTLLDTICYLSIKQDYETSWVSNTWKSVVVNMFAWLVSINTNTQSGKSLSLSWYAKSKFVQPAIPRSGSWPTCNGQVWTTFQLQYPTLYKPQHTPVVQLSSTLTITLT